MDYHKTQKMSNILDKLIMIFTFILFLAWCGAHIRANESDKKVAELEKQIIEHSKICPLEKELK